MARKSRVHLPGGYYHVMMRGNLGRDLFFSKSDRSRFLFLCQEGVERYGHRVHAFCLMDNHVHLLIQVGVIPLSKIIQNLSFRYTKYINHQTRETGHLFQGRYKAIVVDADSYLLELSRYIHLNPVRSGLCKKADEFEWSSHRAYMGSMDISWLYTQEILARFSSDASRARELFLDFVLLGMGEESRPEFQHGLSMGLILGDDHFVEKVLQESGSEVTRTPTLIEVFEVVCLEYEIDISTLYEQGRSHRYSEARAMASFIIQSIEGITLTSLAKELSWNLSALSQSAGRLQKRIKENQTLKIRAKKLMHAIEIHKSQS